MENSNNKCCKKYLEFNSQSGASLIEIVMVLVIIAIIVTFAVAQFGASRSQLKRQNIARQLKVSFERARFDSVKRRAATLATQAKVVVNETWFSLTTDDNQNNVIDTNETVVTNFANDGIRITGNNMTFPVTLTYDERGNVVAKGNDGLIVNPVFYVCNGVCTSASATAVNSNIVLVSTTGTVNLLNGGASIPSFANPGVSPVPGGTLVNSLVAIITGTATATPNSTATATATVSATTSASASPSPSASLITPSPSPTYTSPSVSPTATATQNATPVVTVTPTPIYTATPTPTPVYCTTNQKPSQTGCTCKYPMIVYKSGRCY